MKDLMSLPSSILDRLESDELVLVRGGSNPDDSSPNNGDGLCSGSNNAGGKCSGSNNAGGNCG